MKVSSATLILLKITWAKSESAQNISRRVVVWLLINITHQACFGCSECERVNSDNKHSQYGRKRDDNQNPQSKPFIEILNDDSFAISLKSL